MTEHDTTPDPTPEQWAALRRLQAKIRRIAIGVTTIRVQTAALTIELAARRKPGKVRARRGREAFLLLTNCQQDVLAIPGLDAEPELAPTLARVPNLIDAALDLSL